MEHGTCITITLTKEQAKALLHGYESFISEFITQPNDMQDETALLAELQRQVDNQS